MTFNTASFSFEILYLYVITFSERSDSSLLENLTFFARYLFEFIRFNGMFTKSAFHVFRTRNDQKSILKVFLSITESTCCTATKKCS